MVPAFNEEKLIRRVLETMPSFVDRVVVVDGGSKDSTVQGVGRHQIRDGGILLVRHHLVGIFRSGSYSVYQIHG